MQPVDKHKNGAKGEKVLYCGEFSFYKKNKFKNR
jgi:hypothetical protein